MPEDDSQFGMLYSALLLLEGAWSASVEVFQGCGSMAMLGVPAVMGVGAAQGLPHCRPGLLQAMVAQGEGLGGIRSLLPTMSLMVILKYSGKEF